METKKPPNVQKMQDDEADPMREYDDDDDDSWLVEVR